MFMAIKEQHWKYSANETIDIKKIGGLLHMNNTNQSLLQNAAVLKNLIYDGYKQETNNITRLLEMN